MFINELTQIISGLESRNCEIYLLSVLVSDYFPYYLSINLCTDHEKMIYADIQVILLIFKFKGAVASRKYE